MSEHTLGEHDCALLRTHAYDLRCAVARLWVEQPCTPAAQHASAIKSCVADLMALANEICSLANKTCAPQKACCRMHDAEKECGMDDAA